jgi:S1-C subfamily serine protease
MKGGKGKLDVASSDVQSIAESSVGIETDGSTGSGTIIAHVGRSSYVLTCEHVVRGYKKARIVYRSGKRFVRVEGTVERSDERKDLSLVRVKKLPLPALSLAPTEPELYERVFVVGSPEGYFGTATESLLCGKDGSNGDPDESYQLSGFTSPGGSGGTVGNFNGQLVGVVTGIRHDGHRPVHGIVFACPLGKIKEFLADGKGFAERAKRQRKAKEES